MHVAGNLVRSYTLRGPVRAIAVSDLLIITQGVRSRGGWKNARVSTSACSSVVNVDPGMRTKRARGGSPGLFTRGAEREIRFQSKLINMQFVIPRAAARVAPMVVFFHREARCPVSSARARAMHERRLKIHTARICTYIHAGTLFILNRCAKEDYEEGNDNI